jgi:hypothetical protein
LNKRLLKLEIFGHYCKGDPVCVCCGKKTLDFLVIDHIDGGGNQHRKTVKHIYRWLKHIHHDSEFRVPTATTPPPLMTGCVHTAVSVKISEL